MNNDINFDDVEDIAILRSEIDRVGAERKRLETELMLLRQFIRSLQNLADAVDWHPGAEGVMELLEEILQQALSAVNASDGSLMIVDEDSGELVFVVTVGGEASQELAGKRLPAGTGIAGWVAEHREPTVVEDAQSDERFFGGLDQELHYETHSLLATPIIGGGRVIGVVEILNKETGTSFSVDDLHLVSLLCRFAGELLHSLESRVKTAEVP